MITTELDKYIEESATMFDSIDIDRKKLLDSFAGYIVNKVKDDESVNLIFICTHNSRRSHLSQIWAQAASYYYSIANVYCYSGGTEATAFNLRAVKATQKAGFKIKAQDNTDNPLYEVIISSEFPPLWVFSKKYNDQANPQEQFAAVMTCDNADEACPVVLGADARFPIKYRDPKEADDTPLEEKRYNERCRQISIEMLYTFSIVSETIK